MSRQLEQVEERRSTRLHEAVIRTLVYVFPSVLSGQGREWSGFTVKRTQYETLVVLKCVKAGVPEVAFVASSDIIHALEKAGREAESDKLRWRVDRYGGKS